MLWVCTLVSVRPLARPLFSAELAEGFVPSFRGVYSLAYTERMQRQGIYYRSSRSLLNRPPTSYHSLTLRLGRQKGKCQSQEEYAIVTLRDENNPYGMHAQGVGTARASIGSNVGHLLFRKDSHEGNNRCPFHFHHVRVGNCSISFLRMPDTCIVLKEQGKAVV